MTSSKAPDTSFRHALDVLLAGQHMSEDAITALFAAIMDGALTPAQIGGLLVALRMKGETAEELAGAARAMRAKARPFACPDPESAVDTCGTGGDGSGSVNVSTMAAIAAASAGAQVAKHGNRALSSRSGSADVLEALGVKLDASRAVAERCMREVGIAFLFAPAFHAATKHAALPRRELGVRTIFNLLGPLTNPAGVKNQIVGVYAAAWCEPMARALGRLGARRAYVVHGDGGIDEVAVRGPTTMAVWDRAHGEVVMRTVTPADFGLDDADPEDLRGGDAAHNADVVHRVFAGATGAVRNAVVMEAAVALAAIDGAPVTGDFQPYAARVADALDTGASARTLARWAQVSQGS